MASSASADGDASARGGARAGGGSDVGGGPVLPGPVLPGPVLPGPIVSGAWLVDAVRSANDHARDRTVRVVDVRWYLDGRSGQDAYAAGHVPGAVRLDIDTDLAEPASAAQGRHPLPSPARFAAALGRMGVASGTPVVAYDDAGGSVASRLWWLLHVLGEPVAVLDGGLNAYVRAGGELVTDVPAWPAVDRAERAWPAERFVDADQVAEGVVALDGGAAALGGSAVVFDARAAERYAYGADGIDPRPGHVPGARSAPWAGNLGADGLFRDADELRQRFAAAADRPAIAYCGSGVTACHDLLAMELAGLRQTALYPGSWSQWGADASRPTETGP